MIEKIIASCIVCDKHFNTDDMFFHCKECGDEEKIIDVENLKDCIKIRNEATHLWEDESEYEGFKTKEEKIIFMKGVKHGHDTALFWIADYFNLVDFFETLE